VGEPEGDSNRPPEVEDDRLSRKVKMRGQRLKRKMKGLKSAFRTARCWDEVTPEPPDNRGPKYCSIEGDGQSYLVSADFRAETEIGMQNKKRMLEGPRSRGRESGTGKGNSPATALGAYWAPRARKPTGGNERGKEENASLTPLKHVSKSCLP